MCEGKGEGIHPNIHRVTENLSFKPCNDHLDCSVILNNLCQLEKLELTYG